MGKTGSIKYELRVSSLVDGKQSEESAGRHVGCQCHGEVIVQIRAVKGKFNSKCFVHNP